MKTIYKYGIELSDNFIINMPKDAKILSAQIQDKNPFLWALIDTDKPFETKAFKLIGTGHQIKNEDKLKFIDTFQMHFEQLIFHLFEVIKE